MVQRQPELTRPATLLPSTTLFRSHEGEPHFFAYVSLEHKKTRPFLQGLRASTMCGEVFARDMTDAVAKALQRPGLTVHREPQPMDQVLARSSVILHHGGTGTCCAALSAGRPQILLQTHIGRTSNRRQLR